MFGEHFYHKQIRNTVIAFGTIFNNINIKRLDSSGNPLQSLKVPLSYSPKEKFIARLDQQSSLTGSDSSVAITLPRMAFDINGYSYDPTRKLNKNQKRGVVTTNADTTKLNTQYSPVPYDVSIELNVFTANSDDGLQIIEQILPYFQPEYTVTLKESAELDIIRDIPIVLNDIQYEDDYEGDFASRRAIIYTLSFTAKYYLYGPVTSQGVIRSVQVDQYTDLQVTAPKREQRYSATPLPADVAPSDWDADDGDFGFSETSSFFEDAKNYNPTTGQDE